MPGKHGAAKGKVKEEQPGAHADQQPQQQVLQANGPLACLGQQSDEKHHQAGPGHKEKPGDPVGEEKPLPLDGQGVEHPHAPAVHQVGKKGHGQEAAVHRTHEHYRPHSVPDHFLVLLHHVLPVHSLQDLPHGVPQPAAYGNCGPLRPVHHALQVDEGHSQAEKEGRGVKGPQGPEPGQVLFEQSAVEPALLLKG